MTRSHRSLVLLAASFAVGASAPGAIRLARAACDCTVDALYSFVSLDKIAGPGDAAAEQARFAKAAKVIVRPDLDIDVTGYIGHIDDDDNTVVFHLLRNE